MAGAQEVKPLAAYIYRFSGCLYVILPHGGYFNKNLAYAAWILPPLQLNELRLMGDFKDGVTPSRRIAFYLILLIRRGYFARRLPTNPKSPPG